MKKYITPILAFGVSLLLASCVKKSVAPLEGVFPSATELTLTDVAGTTVAKEDAVRSVTLELAGGGHTLTAVLGTTNYYLPSSTYTASPSLANKTYLLGSTKVDGQSVTSGSIILNKSGESQYAEDDVYTMDAMLFTQEGAYHVSWSGSLYFEADPVTEPTSYYLDTVGQVTDDSQAVVAGVESHTLYLTDAANGDFVAQIVLVKPEGTPSSALEGTYAVTEYASKDFQASNGFDLSVYGWDMIIGTYYVEDGANVIVNAGETVTVTALDGMYQIDLSTGGSFLTAPFGYVPGAKPLKSIASIQDNRANGTNSLTVNFWSDGLSGEYNPSTYATDWTSDGYYLALDIYSEDGTLAPGVYNASAAGGTINPGEFGIGYDTEMWGMTFYNWGTCFWTVENLTASAQKILDGTVSVTVEGETYTIILESENVKASYAGPFAAGGDDATLYERSNNSSLRSESKKLFKFY